MILTGTAIAERVENGEICIDPFDPAMTNPNSYNYRLGPLLRTIADPVADARLTPQFTDIPIPDDGFMLTPRRLYLGTTVESIGSRWFVPSLIGRSSTGRLGLFLQISADLGQMGAVHRWTLELTAVQPVRIYAGMIIGQVSFWRPTGAHMPYRGHYGHRCDPAPWDPQTLLGVPHSGGR